MTSGRVDCLDALGRLLVGNPKAQQKKEPKAQLKDAVACYGYLLASGIRRTKNVGRLAVGA